MYRLNTAGVWRYVGLVTISVFLGWNMLAEGFFPSLLFALILATFVAAVRCGRSMLSSEAKTYGVMSLLFSSMLFFRTEPFSVFVAIVGSLVFGSLMVLDYRPLMQLSQALFSPLRALAWLSVVKPKHGMAGLLSQLTGKANTKQKHLMSVLVGFGLLTILVPLLMSANPLFEQAVTKLFTIDWIDEEWFFKTLFRLVQITFLLWFLPRLAESKKHDDGGAHAIRPLGIDLAIPMVMVSLVLGVFMVMQFQLYVMDSAALLEHGITHSERTREVFGQLAMVSVIVYGLLYLAVSKPKSWHRYVYYILLAEGLALNSFALQSVWAYIDSWGLTRKRLWGVTTVVWVYGMYVILVAGLLKRIAREHLVHVMTVFSGVILLLALMAHFDALIYRIRPTTGQGTDYAYLSNLATDSYALYAVYDELAAKCDEAVCDFNELGTLDYLANRLAYTKAEAQKRDWRGWTLPYLLQYG